MSEKQEMVTITKEEYNSLREDSEKLTCLKSWGVDNWGGYGDAMAAFRDSQEEKCKQ
jgi:hypothetical protein